MILCRALSYEENTLDKSLLRRNCWNNMQKNMDLPILFILLMMVSPVQDLIAQAFFLNEDYKRD